LNVPISSIVIKSDTTGTKQSKEEEVDGKDVKDVKKDNKLECVFVKVGDKAKIKIVKTGIQDDSNIEVISGLKKGDVVITGPYNTVSKELNSGDKIIMKTDKQAK